MSRVRTHFCTLVALLYGDGTRPLMYGMNGTIPATVNRRVGSSLISEADGTTVWPFDSKKASQRRLISAVFTATERLRASWRLVSYFSSSSLVLIQTLDEYTI